MKKNAELSMQTLVMMIIALIVLAVIAAIFVSNMRNNSKAIAECPSKGGHCNNAVCGDGEVAAAFVKCQDTTKTCCLKADDPFSGSS